MCVWWVGVAWCVDLWRGVGLVSRDGAAKCAGNDPTVMCARKYKVGALFLSSLPQLEKSPQFDCRRERQGMTQLF